MVLRILQSLPAHCKSSGWIVVRFHDYDYDLYWLAQVLTTPRHYPHAAESNDVCHVGGVPATFSLLEASEVKLPALEGFVPPTHVPVGQGKLTRWIVIHTAYYMLHTHTPTLHSIHILHTALNTAYGVVQWTVYPHPARFCTHQSWLSMMQFQTGWPILHDLFCNQDRLNHTSWPILLDFLCIPPSEKKEKKLMRWRRKKTGWLLLHYNHMLQTPNISLGWVKYNFRQVDCNCIILIILMQMSIVNFQTCWLHLHYTHHTTFLYVSLFTNRRRPKNYSDVRARLLSNVANISLGQDGV